jgi:hypothetical protein
MRYDKLFEPYTGDGHTLEATIKYLTNLAVNKGVAPEVVEMAINEVFSEVAAGREFSKTKCSCGCGIDKAATDLIHTIQSRIFNIDKTRVTAVKDIMSRRYQALMEGEMRRLSKFDKDRDRLINGTLWERLTDWSASPVYCFFKKQNVKANRLRTRSLRIRKYLGK